MNRKFGRANPATKILGVSKSEAFDNIRSNLRGCRRGKGGDLRAAKFFEHGTESKIVWPKIVTPLGYAVGLVDREQPDGDLAKSLQERPAAKPFRRDIDQFELALPHSTDALMLLRSSKSCC